MRRYQASKSVSFSYVVFNQLAVYSFYIQQKMACKASCLYKPSPKIRSNLHVTFEKAKSFLRFSWNFNLKLDSLQIFAENLFYHQFNFMIARVKHCMTPPTLKLDDESKFKSGDCGKKNKF